MPKLPSSVPAMIPAVPMMIPSLKKMDRISFLVAPNVRISAISDLLLMTVISREEMILSEATSMISSKTRKRAFFSISIAEKKFPFCCHQPSIRTISGRALFMLPISSIGSSV